MNRLPQGVEAVGPAKRGDPVPLPLHCLAKQLHVHRLLRLLQPGSQIRVRHWPASATRYKYPRVNFSVVLA